MSQKEYDIPELPSDNVTEITMDGTRDRESLIR